MRKNLLPFQLFAACLVGLILGKFCFSTTKDKVELSLFNGMPSKLQSVINIVENKYVDVIDMDSLTELAIPEVLSHLDPHTSYTPAVKRNDAEKSVTGRYCGIGVEYHTFRDSIQVLCTSPGSPARKAGILTGDKILYVDTIHAVGLKQKIKAINAINGKPGSKVRITVERMGCDTLIPIDVERGYVKVKSVTSAYMIDSLNGYIKIESFGDNAFNEFALQLDKLKKQNLSNLIIDLRDNGGGRVEQAKQIVSELLPSGDTIAFTIARGNNMDNIYVDTTQNALCNSMKIVCLVNSKTASASEIVAGALQDNDRGVILGRRTYGKGLVQTPIQLTDGSVVRLTTQRYYTPSGRSLQKGYDNYHNELALRAKNGELDSASAYVVKDSTEFRTRNGRVVYSKGGVQPDIFVAEPRKITVLSKMDSAYVYERYAAIRHAKYTVQDSASNDMYIRELTENKNATIDKLAEYVRSKGIYAGEKAISDYGDLMFAKLMSYAYHIIDNDDEYCRLNNYGDPDIARAVSAISDNEKYRRILNPEN